MANVKLFWRDAAKAGTITASTAANTYPATNAQTDILADKWKTTGAQATETLVIDLGSAQDITAFAVLGHDLEAADSDIKIQGNASDSWGSPSVDVTLDFNAETLKFFWDSAQTFRYWRFVFTKETAADVRSLGRIMIGQQFICTENAIVDGVKRGREDLSEVEGTKSGQWYGEINTILRTLSIEFPFSSLTQMEEFEEMAETMGITTSWLLSLDDDVKPYDWLFYGRMTKLKGDDLEAWNSDTEIRWDLSLDLIESK